MDNLPDSIQREYDAAVQRTGETPQLKRARIYIPALLRLSPQRVEEYMVWYLGVSGLDTRL